MRSPWTRFRAARAGKLCFKARVYIEGVPADAHQVKMIRGLFATTDIIDGIDNNITCKEESACCCIWVWMENVATLARCGRLDLEEPLEVASPLYHFPELGIEADRPVRTRPLKNLTYDVLLHLDRVLDYSSSPPFSPESHISYHSNVSGLPSEVLMMPVCPTTWGYHWFLWFEAGMFPPPAPRGNVHSRLHFPDGDDGGDGAGRAAGQQHHGHGGDGQRGRARARKTPSSLGTWPPLAEGSGGYHRQLAELVVGQDSSDGCSQSQDQAEAQAPMEKEAA
jgi:hypothetical protein